MGAVAPAAEDQRLAVPLRYAVHPSEQDDVIAAFQGRFEAALESCERAVQERRSPEPRGVLDARELVAVARGETVRDLLLRPGQDIDGEGARCLEAAQ